MRSPTAPRDSADPGLEDLRALVRARVARGSVPPARLITELGGTPVRVRTRSAVKRAIRELIDAGEIAYGLDHGRTILESSFDRPVRVSARITLAPPDKAGTPPAGEVLVRLAAGAAFGAGRHPSTRLALRGIDLALQPGGALLRPGSRALDVGTGTGVLAIAAVALGMSCGLGIDPDPCAMAEARHNARLNRMEQQIRISDQSLEDIGGSFALVAANLRTPSLVRLAGTLRARVGTPGAIVVAGMRNEEREAVVTALKSGGELRVAWNGDEGGWAAVLLQRTSK
jgi:ribosomal protein L11 methyltransferase